MELEFPCNSLTIKKKRAFFNLSIDEGEIIMNK